MGSRAAHRPTRFVANSRNVAARIAKYYGRDSDVLHCPVDLDRFTVGAGRGDYFLVASRLLPYKRIDLAIDAAAMAGVPLLVAGTGPAERALRELASGTTTTMLGYVPDARLNELLGNARAAIVPGEEDFGLVPLEAAATRPSDDRVPRRRRAGNDRRRDDGRLLRRAERGVACGRVAALRSRPPTRRRGCGRTPSASRRRSSSQRLREIVDRVYLEQAACAQPT